jgi:hypothetical protein
MKYSLLLMAVLTYFLGAHAHAEYKTVYSLVTPQEQSTYILDTKSIKLTPTGATATLEVGYGDKAVMIGKTPVRYTLQNILVNCFSRTFAVKSLQYFDMNNMLLRQATISPFYRIPKPDSGQSAIVYSVCNFDNS